MPVAKLLVGVSVAWSAAVMLVAAKSVVPPLFLPKLDESEKSKKNTNRRESRNYLVISRRTRAVVAPRRLPARVAALASLKLGLETRAEN